MFQDLQVVGVILSLIVIIVGTGATVHYVMKQVETDRMTALFTLLIGAMVSLYVCDKIIAFKIHLLSEEERKAIWQLIFMIISFVIGRESKTNKT